MVEPWLKTVFDVFRRHHFKARPTVFDSEADAPKDMVGIPVLKVLRQWPIGILSPLPMAVETIE